MLSVYCCHNAYKYNSRCNKSYPYFSRKHKQIFKLCGNAIRFIYMAQKTAAAMMNTAATNIRCFPAVT